MGIVAAPACWFITDDLEIYPSHQMAKWRIVELGRMVSQVVVLLHGVAEANLDGFRAVLIRGGWVPGTVPRQVGQLSNCPHVELLSCPFGHVLFSGQLRRR